MFWSNQISIINYVMDGITYSQSELLNCKEILRENSPATDRTSNYVRYVVYFALAFLSILSFLLLTLLVVLYKGGVALDVGTTLFNYHPLLMTMGLLLFPVHAMLVYRFVPKSKLIQKIIHSFLMFAGLFISIIGLTVAEVSLLHGKQYHIWSIHSWFGLLTVCMFIVQFAFALLALSLPIGLDRKARIIVLHKYSGIILTLLPMMTISLGITQFRSSEEMHVSPFNGETIVGNVICVCLFTLTLLVSSTIVGPLKDIIRKVTTNNAATQYYQIN